MIDSPPLYKEQQVFPFRVVIFVVFVLMFAAIPTFNKLPWWMALGCLLIGILIAAIVNSLMVMRVQITQDYLQFGLWVSSPKLKLSDIQKAEIVDIPKLAGVGIHRWRNYWVYNANWGRGLKVKTQKKAYMIGSNTPEQFLSALTDAMRRPQQP